MRKKSKSQKKKMKRERTNFGSTAQELEVVTGHKRTLGVAHQVNLGGLGRSEDLVDKGRQLRGTVLNLVQSCNEVDSGEGSVGQAVDTVTGCLQAGAHIEPVIVLVGNLFRRSREKMGGRKKDERGRVSHVYTTQILVVRVISGTKKKII